MKKIEDWKYWAKREITDARWDWGNKDINKTWIDGYWNSIYHPHRKLIVNALKTFSPAPNSLFEIGCNAGPNLARIKIDFPNILLSGMDINKNAVERASAMLSKSAIDIGNISKGLLLIDKSVDIVLGDAVLLYIGPKEIRKVINEIVRVARRGVILVEWFDIRSKLGKIKDFHWARNYQKLLEEKGLMVEKIKIPNGSWPTKSGNWERNGYIFVARFPQV